MKPNMTSSKGSTLGLAVEGRMVSAEKGRESSNDDSGGGRRRRVVGRLAAGVVFEVKH